MTRRHYFFFLLLFIVTLHCAEAQALIPLPVEMQRDNGSFTLTTTSTIGYSSDGARVTAEQFAKFIRVPLGTDLIPAKSTSASVQFSLNVKSDAALGSEGYRLAVSPERVLITANTSAGLYYGMQTLLQLFPPAIEAPRSSDTSLNIPVVTITDAPRFGWRGIMLDVSRHFFPKEDVKKFITEIARYKFNVLHWHLSDDNGWRVEIKSYPKLTSVGAWRVERFGHFGDRDPVRPGEPATVGGFYTQEEIKEIVAFAAQHHITIVPEIDLPGHSMAAIAAYPWLSTQKETVRYVDPGTPFAEWFGNGTFKMNIENTLDPSDEKVYAFIDKVIGEMAPLFPGTFFHVGGDECYAGYWEQNAQCQALMKKRGYTSAAMLHGYFMERVEKIVRSKGKRMIGWDEITDGPLDPSSAVMSWRGVSRGAEAAKKGYDVVMSPTTFAYLDYNQGEPSVDPPVYANLRARKTYAFDPDPDGTGGKRILGGQGNLWTEQIPHLRAAEYMLYPRAWALSEVLWSPAAKKNWNDFTGRMEEHFLRADAGGISASRSIYDAIVTARQNGDVLTVSLESEVAGLEIRATVDGTMPVLGTPVYTSPIVVPPGPVTLRVQSFRNDAPIGHLITLSRDELLKRVAR